MEKHVVGFMIMTKHTEKLSKCLNQIHGNKINVTNEIRLLNRRFESKVSCSIEELEGILQSLYIMEGQNLEGRVREISLLATIAAYEAFIHEKKKGENE